MATAPFDARIVSVPTKYRGQTYQGRTLGSRESSLFLHLAQRVVADGEWAHGLTEQEYVDDLRRAVRDPSARLAVYERRGGHPAAVLSPNRLQLSRLGSRARASLLVVYAADRGILLSGYQTEATSPPGIPRHARWLR